MSRPQITAIAIVLLFGLLNLSERGVRAGRVLKPQGPTNYHIALVAVNGNYLSAEYGGSTRVTANKSKLREWETFTLTDLNGGDLEDGDQITLTSSGRPNQNGPQKLQAQDGGGNYIYANYPSPGVREEWTNFTILKLDSYNVRTKKRDKITTQDSVALQTSGGNLVDVITPENATAHSKEIAPQAVFRFVLLKKL